MEIVTLTGKTKKGKQRVQQHGDKWEVVRRSESVGFPTKHPGPFLLLRALGRSDLRWVSESSDPDFFVDLSIASKVWLRSTDK